MRTPHSRFSTFVGAVHPDFEGGPAAPAAPATSKAPVSSALSVLELRYPTVVRTLTLLWGYPELNEYLNRIATGADPRLTHLEPAAMAELMVLAEVHRRICPQVPGRRIEQVYGAGQWSGPWRPARYRG